MIKSKYTKVINICVILAFIVLFSFGISQFNFQNNADSKIIFEGYNSQVANIDDAQSEMQSAEGNVEVTVELNYDEDKIESLLKTPKPDADAGSAEVDRYIANHRARMKNYFSSYNEGITKDWEVDANIVCSQYSPYVFLEYESNVLSDESYKQLYSIAENNKVEKIFIHNQEKKVPQYTMSSAMDATDVKNDVENRTLTGNGVTIAILEANHGVVHKNNSNFSGKNLIVRGNLFNKESDHATLVASIAAGHQGVAKNAKVLSGYVLTNGSTVIDWFLDNGANIVNCSYGIYTDNKLGKYTSESAYLDYMTRNNWLTFVKSAGNRNTDNPSLYVSPPGTGYNVITVGAASSNNLLADYSCYNLNGSYMSKPTLIAPGDYSGIPNTIVSATNKLAQGTSYSAPFVSGCIALLMEYKPILKTTPEIVIAALTASANKMGLYNEYSASGFEKKTGAGMINFEKAKSAIDNYYTFTRSGGASSGTIKDTMVIVGAGKTLQVSLAWIVKTNQGNANLGLSDYDLEILDLQGNIVAEAKSNTNNVEMVRYTSEKVGIYKIRIKQFGEALYDDWGAMCYNVY